MMKRDGVWYTGGNVPVTDPEQIRELDGTYPNANNAPIEIADPHPDDVEQPAPAGETKSDAFKRLARQRMTNAIAKIRLIGNLSSTASYEYTEEQIEQMKNALIEEIAIAFGRFTKKDKDKPLFDFK